MIALHYADRKTQLNFPGKRLFSYGWEKAVIGSAAKQSPSLSIEIASSFHSSQ